MRGCPTSLVCHCAANGRRGSIGWACCCRYKRCRRARPASPRRSTPRWVSCVRGAPSHSPPPRPGCPSYRGIHSCYSPAHRLISEVCQVQAPERWKVANSATGPQVCRAPDFAPRSVRRWPTFTAAAPSRPTRNEVWDVLADFGSISSWADNIDHSCILNHGPGEPIGTTRRVQIGRDALVEHDHRVRPAARARLRHRGPAQAPAPGDQPLEPAAGRRRRHCRHADQHGRNRFWPTAKARRTRGVPRSGPTVRLDARRAGEPIGEARV